MNEKLGFTQRFWEALRFMIEQEITWGRAEIDVRARARELVEATHAFVTSYSKDQN